MTVNGEITVLIASFLEEEHVRRISAEDPRIRVIYEPDLLRPPRYAADHKGAARERTPDQEARWREHLAAADILFDFDQTHREDLPELAPNVRWIQSTSSGIGQFVAAMGYGERMPNTVFTKASGVHSQPLAEFCLMVMLMFRKGLLRMVRDQARKHWERYAGTDLEGRTVVIVGLGAVGQEVVRASKGLGMWVIGVDRTGFPLDSLSSPPDEFFAVGNLRRALPRAEHLVLSAPHTPETENLIAAEELALMPQGAILINIGRGALVDESDLAEALASGHLGGAGLDVFVEEPLPENSPLWDLPNVLISPHSGSTSDNENRRITDLFCENLKRFLAAEPMINVLDLDRLY
jgi:phosphoglycerate dehydrogenase-like enzyme